MVSAWHPDRMGQREERVRTLATEQMVAINAAYDFLRGREVGTAGIA
jgi:curved DNA-binding protein CbpA